MTKFLAGTGFWNHKNNLVFTGNTFGYISITEGTLTDTFLRKVSGGRFYGSTGFDSETPLSGDAYILSSSTAEANVAVYRAYGETWAYRNTYSGTPYATSAGMSVYASTFLMLKPLAGDLTTDASNGFEVHAQKASGLPTVPYNGALDARFIGFKATGSAGTNSYQLAWTATSPYAHLHSDADSYANPLALTTAAGSISSIVVDTGWYHPEIKIRLFWYMVGAGNYDAYVKFSFYCQSGAFMVCYRKIITGSTTQPSFEKIGIGTGRAAGASSIFNVSLYGISSANASTLVTNIATNDFTPIRRYYPLLKNFQAQYGTTGWDSSPTPNGGIDTANTTAAYNALTDGNVTTFGTSVGTNYLGYTNTTAFQDIVTANCWITNNGSPERPSFSGLKSITTSSYRIADVNGEELKMKMGNKQDYIAGTPGANAIVVQTHNSEDADWATLKNGSDPITGADTAIPFAIGQNV